jgi:mono/diheme cytochrome c family protein
MRARFLAIAGVGVFAAAAAWFVFDNVTSRRHLALGKRIYAERCAACHGVNLEGQPNWQTPLANGRLPAPPHDASGHSWHHSDAELFLITKNGMAAVVADYESDMPAFEGVLTDAEIEAARSFIKSAWPAREREYQEARSRADQR